MRKQLVSNDKQSSLDLETGKLEMKDVKKKEAVEKVEGHRFSLGSASASCEWDVVAEDETQLDRIEKKMDRILELLEGKELSTSINLDGKKIAESLKSQIEILNHRHDRLSRGNPKHRKQ
ncbi:hypothetical protein BCBBV1cgp52 [Bacillus phage BCASJ1c]|uniref:52 n=1 Tax=Bacillus phage BCASJ1c TaxID=294382 RepID=Q5YA58_9CAUD|nr:hypothetical protein BCBBV1cgp52 [Bacillus phage BCASJ1c]AAU85099.1 52 [Bacillus phage BCASJ1c]